MPVKHCCYGKCKSDSRYADSREEMNGVVFLPFPKPKTQLEKCTRWVKLCGRKFFSVENVRKDTYICSKHFVGGEGPTVFHPDPLPAVSTDFERRILSIKRRRKAPAYRAPPEGNNKRSVETGVNCSYNISQSIIADHSYHLSPQAEVGFEPDPTDGLSDVTIEVTTSTDTDTNINNVSSLPSEICKVEIGVQTDIELKHLNHFSTEALTDHSNLRRHLFVDSVLKHDDSCKFYTGLSLNMFFFLFSWIMPKAERLRYWRAQDTNTANNESKKKTGPKRKLSLKEEFLVTLLRLKRGFDVEVLSDLFGVHSSSISRVFTTWINFLYLELNFLIAWPTKEQIKLNRPKAFRHFPKTRTIIDCTEFFVQKPSLPSSQRLTWSQYKHHNTLKALICISPSGTFTFISKLYTGSISDRRIVEQSGFLSMLEHGDDVMADRGFLIRDLLARQSATLNIPPFSLGRQLSSRAVTKTRRIACARIHVERAIGRLKTYKLLQGIMPLRLHALFDQVIGVCACLCNLDSRLVT